MYQLSLGDETYASVIDRIVERACAIDDTLDAAACRRLVELVFQARVRKTDACGNHPECRGAWAGWTDPDLEAVPAMFAVAAADLTDVPRSRRALLESRLAAEMRALLRELVLANPSCGHAEVCRADPQIVGEPAAPSAVWRSKTRQTLRIK